ncbi:60Kd inner membrane protein-domain-containing protein [Rhodocollybia butyracea]|uniref:60Kd inner membrane protein-domain-containing protein n=1 Tax=Rhodocollybia butyracea TaxID=206335 RepID=A0A9P5UE07_9AGAR|nr:60Kd inner membrane protein-domain-containing protein [Rhodocollybia butyracea]
MLSTRLRPSSCLRYKIIPPTHKRHFVQYFNEGFLDLALALPYPVNWPAYSATIILATVAFRTALLPVAFWTTSRRLRYEEHVLPVLRQMRPIVMHEQAIAMRAEGLLEDQNTRGKIHAKRCHDIMKVKEKELVKTHKCRTVTTAWLPFVTQAPLFMAMTICFARLAADPTSPFDSESFLTLTTLNHPDVTFTLPVILGLVTMANVESSHWILNPAEKEALKASEKNMAETVEKSGNKWLTMRFKLRSNMKDSMRIMSVFRIGLASIAPGAVTLYWLTSAIFGLGQTWLVNWVELKKRRELKASMPSPMSLAELQEKVKATPKPSGTESASEELKRKAKLQVSSKPRKSKGSRKQDRI